MKLWDKESTENIDVNFLDKQPARYYVREREERKRRTKEKNEREERKRRTKERCKDDYYCLLIGK